MPTTVAAPSTVTQTVVETVVEPRPVVDGECSQHDMKSGNGVVWTQDGGVMAIMVKSGAVTAEGLPVDLAPSDPRVAATYPAGEPGPNGYSVWVRDGVFYFMSGSTTLARRGQHCFN